MDDQVYHGSLPSSPPTHILNKKPAQKPTTHIHVYSEVRGWGETQLCEQSTNAQRSSTGGTNYTQHAARNQGDEAETSELLAEKDIAIDAPGAQGRTALHRALGSGHKGVAALLLDANADPTKEDSCKRTSESLGHTQN